MKIEVLSAQPSSCTIFTWVHRSEHVEDQLCPCCVRLQADIVNLLNDHLSLDLDVEDPWQKFDLGQAGVGSEAATPDDQAGQAVKQATTLLNGHDLPSDTDDSSFKYSAVPCALSCLQRA